MRRNRNISRTPTVTTQPDPPAPPLSCPVCDRPLMYRQTVIGVMRPPERYDFFECKSCGPFELRHRTNRLRAVRV